MVYKNTTAWTSSNFGLPVVTRILRRHAEVKDQMPQPHDAVASAQCHGGTLMSVTLINQPPSEPQLWLLRAASCLCKHYCAAVKNQGLIVVMLLQGKVKLSESLTTKMFPCYSKITLLGVELNEDSLYDASCPHISVIGECQWQVSHNRGKTLESSPIKSVRVPVGF